MLFDWALIIFGTATDPLKDNAIPEVTTSPPDTASTTKQSSDKGTAISGR